jgi:hypothetical protein
MKSIAIIALMALVITIPLLAGCGGIPEEVQDELDQLRADKQQWEEVDKPALENEIAELQNLRVLAPSPQDPTYSALMTWIAQDQTNTLTFYPEGYYATTLFAFAREAGIYSYLTKITIADPIQRHWYFTAFNTTDKGVVYIRPAQDKVITLQVGKTFHELNDLPPFDGVDDTILKIELFE